MFPWSNLLESVPKKSGSTWITVNIKQIDFTGIPQIELPRVDKVVDTPGGGSVLSVFNYFNSPPDSTNGSTCLKAPPATPWYVSAMWLVTGGVNNI